MSYILDALRRAQAERGRGAVPGLHTPGVSVPVEPVQASQRSAAHRGAWLFAALAAVAALVLAWLQFSPRPAERQPVVVAQAPVAEPVPVPVAPAVPTSVPASQARPAPVVVDVTPPPAPPPIKRVEPEPKTTRQESAKPAKNEAQTAAKPAGPAASAPAAPAAAPASAAPPAAAPVYNVANLPPAVREQLPTLQLAGITYSSNAQFRMVIVNGQVLHEGDTAAPGLALERIEPTRTIWTFKGYRYALP